MRHFISLTFYVLSYNFSYIESNMKFDFFLMLNFRL